MQLATEAGTTYSYQAALPGAPRGGYSPAGIAVRLFLTCWILFVLHFASNTVREIYLALAIGDHFSFRVDDYARLHPDLFEKPGYGWHIGANPGASMLAAIPYALTRPAIDRVVERVNAGRRAGGRAEPPAYNSPWPMARAFYAEAWRRGLDVKFGLGALVMQALCMAPSSALAVVFLFYLLRRLLESDRAALWLSLLYAFGTPVLFRTGYLSHNLMLGHIAFMGFLAMWNPGSSPWPGTRTRYFLGGLAGGTAVLFDYSGGVPLLVLFAYGLLKRLRKAALPDAARHAAWYVAGSLGPVLLLWFYQWRSFGNPFLPGQHWMPPVEWIDRGYQGFGPPQFELLWLLLFDYRYGLFLSAPLLVLGALYPLAYFKRRDLLPPLELWAMLAVAAGMWLFFGGVNYTRLQFNTGIRYLSAVFPFLFVPAALLFVRMPRPAQYLVGLACVAEAWCLAMHRDVERGLGLLDPILSVFVGGFKLPALTVLSRMGGQYSEHFANGVSALPLFALSAAVIYGLWSPRIWRAR
ncbi:MAG: hypothetical protein IT158_26180 [Bryobacterales bacterium]|nr:hypothetical protein [Bryobacterales bacterium]